MMEAISGLMPKVGCMGLAPSFKLPKNTWVSLAIIQLTGEATLWWDPVGYNSWSLTWANFAGIFLSRFTPLDLPPLAPIFYQESASRYKILS